MQVSSFIDRPLCLGAWKDRYPTVSLRLIGKQSLAGCNCYLPSLSSLGARLTRSRRKNQDHKTSDL